MRHMFGAKTAFLLGLLLTSAALLTVATAKADEKPGAEAVGIVYFEYANRN